MYKTFEPGLKSNVICATGPRLARCIDRIESRLDGQARRSSDLKDVLLLTEGGLDIRGHNPMCQRGWFDDVALRCCDALWTSS